MNVLGVLDSGVIMSKNLDILSCLEDTPVSFQPKQIFTEANTFSQTQEESSVQNLFAFIQKQEHAEFISLSSTGDQAPNLAAHRKSI